MPLATSLDFAFLISGNTSGSKGFGKVLLLTDETGSDEEDFHEFFSADEIADVFDSETDTYSQLQIMLSQETRPESIKVLTTGSTFAVWTFEVENDDVAGTYSFGFITRRGTGHDTSVEYIDPGGNTADETAAGIVAALQADEYYSQYYSISRVDNVITMTMTVGGLDIFSGLSYPEGQTITSSNTVANVNHISKLETYMETDDDFFYVCSVEKKELYQTGLCSWGASKELLFWFQTHDSRIEDLVDLDDMSTPYFENALGYRNCFFVYSPDTSKNIANAIVARMAGIDLDTYAGTFNFKRLVGIEADRLASSEQARAEDHFCGYYALLDRKPFTYNIVSTGNIPAQMVLVAYWMNIRFREKTRNLLERVSNANSVIPFDDSGFAMITSELRTLGQRAEAIGHLRKKTFTIQYTPYSLLSSQQKENRKIQIQWRCSFAGQVDGATASGTLELPV